MQCAGTNFGKSVFIWLNGYSFVNTPLPHFPVSIIPGYMNLFKGFCCLLRTCFCQMDFKFLFSCLINISKFRWQTWINLFFLPIPTRINRMNKLKFLFSHFFLLPQKEGLDTKKKREIENLSWFLFLQFFCCRCCFLKYKGTARVNKLFLDSYNQLKQYDLSKNTFCYSEPNSC